MSIFKIVQHSFVLVLILLNLSCEEFRYLYPLDLMQLESTTSNVNEEIAGVKLSTDGEILIQYKKITPLKRLMFLSTRLKPALKALFTPSDVLGLNVFDLEIKVIYFSRDKQTKLVRSVIGRFVQSEQNELFLELLDSVGISIFELKQVGDDFYFMDRTFDAVNSIDDSQRLYKSRQRVSLIDRWIKGVRRNDAFPGQYYTLYNNWGSRFTTMRSPFDMTSKDLFKIDKLPDWIKSRLHANALEQMKSCQEYLVQ